MSVGLNRLEEAVDAEQAIFIGYYPMEDAPAKMLCHSIRARTDLDVPIIPIIRDELLAFGHFNRALDPKGSTQFSLTRFLVPYLMNFNGTGIFFDCDMLITRNIQEMFDLLEPRYAVQVPKHDYLPKTTTKMDGRPQSTYPRKQWSAVVIYNCEHPSNRVLINKFVETQPPAFLHRFQWLDDEEIGDLPLEYNFLVEEQELPDELPFNIHHTLGSPIFRERQNVDFAEYWKAEFRATFGCEFSERNIVN